ncbi:hypothetical protein C8R45DRAFT_824167 [Mycena sanguinolenta]|nr:hypothetical protein C8R45DRAFT_824167 [Mycena sanguinolenta]
MFGKSANPSLLSTKFVSSPANREELFNLHHASARNILERIFGVFSRAPEYDMDIQARIPPALAVIHNFILRHDDVEWEDILAMNAEDPNPGFRNDDLDTELGTLAAGPTDDAEKARSESRRDVVAQAMWESYQDILQERGEEFR